MKYPVFLLLKSFIRPICTASMSLWIVLTTYTLYAADIKIINDGKEALNARIHLIDNAQHTIEMSYFIFENDIRKSKKCNIKSKMYK